MLSFQKGPEGIVVALAGKGRKAKDGQKIWLNKHAPRPTHGVILEAANEGKSLSKKRKRDERNMVDVLGVDWFTRGRGAREKRKIGKKEIKMLRNAFDLGTPDVLEGPKQDLMIELYEKALKTQNDRKEGKVLTLSESSFFTPMPGAPGLEDRTCAFIAGPPK